MKILKYLIPTILIGLIIAGTAYAVTVFNSAQVGSSPANGRVLQTNGSISTWVATSTLGFISGSGFTNVATGTSGTIFNVSTTTSTITINLPFASASNTGQLQAADWTTFNNKQIAGNYLTALTGDGIASGPGSAAFTLATVNGNVGSFGSSTAIPNFTVNGKGLITGAGTNVVIAPAGTLSGTTLSSGVTGSSLTSVGTLGTLTVSGQTSLTNASTTNLTIANMFFTPGMANGCVQVSSGIATSTGTNCGSGGGSGGLGTTTPFTSGYVPYATGTNITLTNSNIYNTAVGKVGIGTSTPGNNLTVIQTTTGNDATGLLIDGSGNAANADIDLNRGSSSAGESNIDFNTLGTEEWQLGLQNNSSNDFELWDGSDNPAFTINHSTLDAAFGTTTATAELTIQNEGGSNLAFNVLSSTGATALSVDGANNVNVATLTPSSLIMSDPSSNLRSVVLGTNLSFSGNTLNATGGAGGSPGGNPGQVQYNSAGTFAGSGDEFDNGVVAGVNATSSTINYLVQGTGSNTAFNVSSSSTHSILQVLSSNGVMIPINASSTNSSSTVASTVPVLQLGQNNLTSPSANGTALGITEPVGFTGNLLDAQTNNVSEFNVSSAGVLNINNNLNFISAGNTIGSGGTAGSLGNKLTYPTNTSQFDWEVNSGTNQANASAAGLSAFAVIPNFAPAAGGNPYYGIQDSVIINQTTNNSTGTVSGIYENPTLTSVYDYRNFNEAAITVNEEKANNAGVPQALFNNVFSPITYQTTSTTPDTSASATTLSIMGAPIASTTSYALTNSIAAYINGGNLNASSTSGYAAYLNSSKGAVNNWALGLAGDFQTIGASPALTSCGGTPSIRGTDTAGEVTVGTTATGCTISFTTTKKFAPFCTITNQSMSVTNAMTYSISTSAITVSQAVGLSGDLLDYTCIQANQ